MRAATTYILATATLCNASRHAEAQTIASGATAARKRLHVLHIISQLHANDTYEKI